MLALGGTQRHPRGTHTLGSTIGCDGQPPASLLGSSPSIWNIKRLQHAAGELGLLCQLMDREQGALSSHMLPPAPGQKVEAALPELSGIGHSGDIAAASGWYLMGEIPAQHPS